MRFALLSLLGALLVAPAHAEITIGLAEPLTGPNAWGGEAAVKSASLAVAKLNGEGGLLGQKLVVEVVDDHCDADQAIAAANKLIAARVAVVIGHTCSGAATPASEVYDRAGVILISDTATNPEFTERGLKNVFRVCGRDDQQGALAAEYISAKLAGKPVAIVHDARAYGSILAEELQRRLRELGTHETMFAQVVPGQLDFGALVTELDRVGISVLYYAGYSQEAGLLVWQAKERLPHLKVIAGDGVSNNEFAFLAGSAADGVLMTSYPDERSIPTAAEFFRSYEKAGYRAGAEAPPIQTYAAIEAWTEAVKVAGTTASREVEKTLRAGKFVTALGTLGFDAKGDVTGIETFKWYVWRNGDYTSFNAGIGP